MYSSLNGRGGLLLKSCEMQAGICAIRNHLKQYICVILKEALYLTSSPSNLSHSSSDPC